MTLISEMASLTERVSALELEIVPPSQRVFKLLKNTTLEDATFSQIQGTGNPIFVDQMNEKDLYALVLSNLARLCVAQNWDGLLTGGGGGGTQYAFEPIDASLLVSTYRRFSPTDVYRLQSTTTVATSMDEKALFMRFVVPKDGTMGEITIRTTGTNTGKDDVWIGIYESSSGLPTTRIGDITIDVNGGADLYSSSDWNTAPELTAGDTIWIGFVPEGASMPTITTANQLQYLSLGFTHYPGTAYNTLFNNTGTDYDMPSTVDLDLIVPKNTKSLYVWSFKYA